MILAWYARRSPTAISTKVEETTQAERIRIKRLNDIFGKVQVGNDQEKAQSEKNSHSKNRGGKN